MSGQCILVVAAHPDDEVLGCGGTMARHVTEGDEVHVVIAGEGITSRAGPLEKRSVGALAEAARDANKIIGTASLELLGLPDNRMDTQPLLDLIQRIEPIFERLQPAAVYTHHAGDLNVDHRRVHQAVVTACRPLPGQALTTLLFFEVPSSTEWQSPGSAAVFMPNWYVDIGTTWEKKAAALASYAGEMRPWPHARSMEAIQALARWRGASAGVTAAEAFQLGRRVVRG